VELWPVALTSASLTGQPLHAPAPPPEGTASVLRLSLKTTHKDKDFAGLAPEKLRFFIRAPWTQAVELFDLLHNQISGIGLGEHAEDKEAVFLDPSHMKLAGFSDDEAMLPRSNRSFRGYMLLSEFFGFAEKFLFFDISGLSGKAMKLEKGRDRLDICLYLKEWKPELGQKVSASSFALGCTPIINLFERKAEPITFDGTRTDYAIIPDARHFRHTEVYSVDRVSMATGKDDVFDAPAFFGLHKRPEQPAPDGGGQIFWQFRHIARNGGHADQACLSLFDGDLHPAAMPGYTATLDITCFNRDLPTRLTFGAGRPHLRCHATEAVKALCLTPPQPALRPSLPEDGHWRLLSHLMLNHLSLCGADGAGPSEAAETLRAILRLYDRKQAPETRSFIEGISAVTSAPETARLADGGIARGLKVTVVFAHQRIDRAAAFFLAKVLERFFGLYCAINSFTRLDARMDNGQEPFFRGQPVTGERWLS
jgi:type VI secretion system protein ImpG